MTRRKVVVYAIWGFVISLLPLWILWRQYLQARRDAYYVEISGNISTVKLMASQYMIEMNVDVVPDAETPTRTYESWSLPKPIAGEDYNDLFPFPQGRLYNKLVTEDGMEVISSGAGPKKRAWYFF